MGIRTIALKMYIHVYIHIMQSNEGMIPIIHLLD